MEREREKRQLVFDMAAIGTNNSVNSINHSIEYLAKLVLGNCVPLGMNRSDHVFVGLREG